MVEADQFTLEAPPEVREADFEQELFKDGPMPRMTSDFFADLIKKRHQGAQGQQFFEDLAREMETHRNNDAWNAEFARQVPSEWLYPAAIENDVRFAGAYDLVLSPTMAHAIAVHPDKHLLTELAYWQPLRAEHAAQVFRELQHGPLKRFWSYAPLDEQGFLERQQAKGATEEVLDKARELAENPDAPALDMHGYRIFDPREQPEYVRRGLARELGISRAMTDRLAPSGLEYLTTRRRVGKYDSPGIDTIASRLMAEHTHERTDISTIVSLVKRGAGAMAAMLTIKIIGSPNHSLAFDLARRPLHHDFPFPELREARDLFEKVVKTVAEDGMHGTDSIGRNMVRDAKARQPEVIHELCADERMDGELLELLYRGTRLSGNDLSHIYECTEDLARTLFDIEKYKPVSDYSYL